MKMYPAYYNFFKELTKSKYETYSVYDYFFRKRESKKKVNVIIRVDVDWTMKGCVELAKFFKKKGINASFYFLTIPERHYNIWKTDIVKKVSDMGFEIGLHTDHFYDELTKGIDAKKQIKKDLNKMEKLIRKKIHGMVYHGTKEMNKLKRLNVEAYIDTKPEELGLDYHDGRTSIYSRYKKMFWEPNTDYNLSDFCDIRAAWKNYGEFAIRKLKKVKQGESIHVTVHTINIFEGIDFDKNMGINFINFLKSFFCYSIKPILKKILKRR